MTRTTTRFLAAAALVCLVASIPSRLPALAQSAGSLIKVDFLAVGPDGKPVTDLKPENISLKVANKERPIKSLELVRTVDSAPGAAPVLPEPFGSNTGGSSARHFLFVVEDEGLRPGIERQVRDAVGQLLKSVTPRDRVSLAVLPRGAVRVDPTTNHAAINDALSKVTGRQATEGNDERACRTRDTLEALRGVLAGAGAGPTTAIVFSSSMTGQNRTAGVNASNRCELTTSDFQKITSAVDGARATVYVVNPDTSANTNQDGLENLAGVTGGQYFRLASDANPLARIAVETSAYYLVGFEPDASDRAGQAQRMDLKVTREGVTTRARNDLMITRGGGAGGAPSLRDLVRGTQAMSALPLRATGYASVDADGQKMKVLVALEAAEAGVKLASAMIGATDPSGKMLLWTANAEDLARPLVVAAMSLPKGAVRVRAAATDSTGRTGVVDTTVNADVIPAGPLQLSGLVLEVPAGTSAMPKLQFSSADEELIAYFEIYGQDPKLPIQAVVEIAATADGPAIVESPVALTSGGVNRYNAQAKLPVAKLAPGDYVVRAKLTVQGHPTGVSSRTLRKVK